MSGPMRIANVAACLGMVFEAAEKAVGLEPQYLLASNLYWLWWVPAACWAWIAFRNAAGTLT